MLSPKAKPSSGWHKFSSSTQLNQPSSSSFWGTCYIWTVFAKIPTMLSLLKKPLLIILLITAIGGSVYFFQKKQGVILGQDTSVGEYLEENFPAVNQAVEKLPFSASILGVKDESSTPTQVSQNPLQQTADLTGQQLETLIQNGTKVKDQLNEFISQVKESTQSTPLHERAMEYGQYLYCQQIIKEYEK